LQVVSPFQENVVRQIGVRLSLIAVAGLLVLVSVVRSDDKDQTISLDQIPQKVKEAVNARLPGAEVTRAEKETEHGQVVYDLELKHRGRKYEMDVKEDGTILEIEKEIAAKDVPETITKAVQAKYPDCTIEEVMEVNKVTGQEEKPIHYEVTIMTSAKKKTEVVFSLDGKSVKAEGEEKK
jgi:hypothetical protein